MRRSITASVLAAALAAVAGLTVMASRFSIGGPSLIDDWNAILSSPGQLGDLGRLLNPDSERFRPGWIVWNYLQWHTFGAPTHLTGPQVWGVARLLLLVAGLSTFTALMVGRRRSSLGGLTFAALVGLPPLLVVTVPQFAGDLARYGPQEPLLLGGMTLGGSFVYLGGSRLSRGAADDWAYVLVAAGCALWIFGVYQKEVSLCVLVLAPFLVLGRWRDTRTAFVRLDRGLRLQLTGIGVILLAPLVHVGVETARIATRGDLVYGTDLHATGWTSVGTGLKEMARHTNSPLGWLLLGAALVRVAMSMQRRSVDWPLAGVVLTALAALAWSAQTNVLVSRYYFPTIALLATGLSMTLARAANRTRWLAVAVAVLFASISAVAAYHQVDDWARMEREGVDFIDTVAGLNASGCPVAQTGLGPERAQALPVLVDLHRASSDSCDGRTAYVVAGDRADPALLGICPAAKRRLLGYWEHVDGARLYRCSPLEPGRIAIAERYRLR